MIMDSENKPRFSFKQDFWVSHFAKTTISTTLIALAFDFIFMGAKAHPMDYNQILLGIVAFLLAILTIFIIDKVHEDIAVYKYQNYKNLEQNQQQIMNNQLSREDLDDEIREVLQEMIKG